MDGTHRELLEAIATLLHSSGRTDFRDYVDDPDVACNELVFNNGLRILVEPVAPAPLPPEPPEMGVNPVTIQPRQADGPSLVLSRVHMALPGSRTVRTVAALMHEGKTAADVLGLGTYNEDTVISGLLHLFPNGELVPAESLGENSAWPCRKMVWETSDGSEWHHPDLARAHQAEIDRDGTVGSEGEFNAWYVTEKPGGKARIGQADFPDELGARARGAAGAAGYDFYSGFSSEEDAKIFAAKKGLTITDG